MRKVMEGNPVWAGAHRAVLHAVGERGPLTLPEMPRRWPFTRPALEALVRDMVEDGIMEALPSPSVSGQTAYGLTGRGWAMAKTARLDTTRAAG